MWHGPFDWGWWMFGGWVWMTAFWGLVIWGVVSLIWQSDRHASQPGDGDARAILDARLARGEISIEEYERVRAAIERRAP